MFQAFVQHSLRAYAVLNIGFNILQQAQRYISRNFTFKISVKRLHHDIIGYTTYNHIIITFILPYSTLGDKFQPLMVIAIKRFDFPVT